MLTDKIRLSSETQDPEDFFGSSLGVIFPDDITNQHGDATSTLTYLSPFHGPLPLHLAAPATEDSRKLFSHFLWNASLQLTEFIEENPEQQWSVQGETVLELGAGTGLAGIVAALGEAQRVVISDYPAEEVLANIRGNVGRCLGGEEVKVHFEEEKAFTDEEKEGIKQRKKEALPKVEIVGHEWGTLTDAFSLSNAHTFTKLLVADCLWMPWQHLPLLQSIAHFLAPEGKAWVIAGFHTGREKMRGFYEEEKLRDVGLEVERIWERNAEGGEREWVTDRGVEDVTERKRWLVIGILRRRAG